MYVNKYKIKVLCAEAKFKFCQYGKVPTSFPKIYNLILTSLQQTLYIYLSSPSNPEWGQFSRGRSFDL